MTTPPSFCPGKPNCLLLMDHIVWLHSGIIDLVRRTEYCTSAQKWEIIVIGNQPPECLGNIVAKDKDIKLDKAKSPICSRNPEYHV